MTENVSVMTDVASFSFEEALKELEIIVAKLENGQMKLQDAVDAYERGSALRKHCEKQLEAAESRLTVMTENDRKMEKNTKADPDTALEI
ncbi:exodeoxyribonuclease VII small subunit [Acetobacteraceae bacterium]|nr:exodeoxyribonuclease VII small subunit [Acetobacteraceae bacterium]